jgi:hypothetical protein
MTWLDSPGAFEAKITRGGLHYRSSRLDAVVAAMKEAESDQGDASLWEVAPALYKWRQSDPNEFRARFGEENYNELMEELLEARRDAEFGIPLIVDPASHPSYEPGLWNDGGMIQTSTNCYAYACNDRVGHRPAVFELDEDDEFVVKDYFTPQPGHYGAHKGFTAKSGPSGTAKQRRKVQPGFTGPGVRFDVLQDDFARRQDDKTRRAKLTPFLLNKNQDPVNVPGYYLIALVVCGEDYHWLRQDENSYWSHKPGLSAVKDTDDDDDYIWDPRHATFRDIPYLFECFYQVPAGGVKTWALGDL